MSKTFTRFQKEETAFIYKLIEDCENLPYQDEDVLEAFQDKFKNIIILIFGKSCGYLRDFKSIRFQPPFFQFAEEYYERCWAEGKSKCIRLIERMLNDDRLTLKNNVKIIRINDRLKKFV